MQMLNIEMLVHFTCLRLSPLQQLCSYLRKITSVEVPI